jgi:hypothetical protein
VRAQLTRDLLGRLGAEPPLLPVARQLLQFTVRIRGKVVPLPLRVEELRVALGRLLGPGGPADAESTCDRVRRRSEQEQTVRRARPGETEQEPSRGDDPVVGLDRP